MSEVCFDEGGPPFHIVLVYPEIPQNTGAIGRLCVGTGCALHLIEPLGFDISEKAVRRAGLDYWKDVHLFVYPDLATFWEKNLHPDHHFYLLSARQGEIYTRVKYRRGDYFIFGRESDGLPSALLDSPPGPVVRLPHHAGIRSLNLSNVASIVVYEGLRQLYPQVFGAG